MTPASGGIGCHLSVVLASVVRTRCCPRQWWPAVEGAGGATIVEVTGFDSMPMESDAGVETVFNIIGRD